MTKCVVARYLWSGALALLTKFTESISHGGDVRRQFAYDVTVLGQSSVSYTSGQLQDLAEGLLSYTSTEGVGVLHTRVHLAITSTAIQSTAIRIKKTLRSQEFRLVT